MPEGKIRVSELAKILGMNSSRLITLLGDLGVVVPDQMALVDASLEGRLKGLIRRPSLGGRGMAAARPEPTWLTSIQWPKSVRAEPEPEPEPSRAPAQTGAPATVPPGGPAAQVPGPVPSVEEAEPAATKAAPRPKTVVREPRGPDGIPLPEEPDEGAFDERQPVPRAADRVARPTLPSGRTPAPPPPPPPGRYGAQRPAGPGGPSVQARGGAAAARPGPGPAARPPRLPVGAGAGARPARPGEERALPGRLAGAPRRTGAPGREWARPPAFLAGLGRPAPARGARGPEPPLGARFPPKGPPVGKGAPAARPDRRREGQRWQAGAAGGRGRAGRTQGRPWGEDREERRKHVDRLRQMPFGRRAAAKTAKAAEPVRERATEVVIDGPLTVRELAEKLGVTGAELIKSLIRLGVVASLNQVLDAESARVAVSEMGVTVRTSATAAGEIAPAGAETVPVEEGTEPRPPVVTVMGHVDHGKTSLLDAIRRTNVTAGEAGGITQHIGASTVEWNGRRIVFLDTPGHEAFTAMRARGAQVTDIAVLVVAADDGVMPQTLEALSHARAAKVPIVVALNKIDKPNALPDRVKKQLAEHGLNPEEWGGETIVVPVSAKERTGIDALLDMILLVAEMSELRANPHCRAKGVVIETRLDRGLGPVASVLVQSGTLRIGDPILAGTAFGRVRAMVDDRGNRLEFAGPSTPVEVTGLDELPAAGDVLQVLADEKMAREIASQRDLRRREREMGATRAAANLADLFEQIRGGERKQLNLVLKADVQGSLEALRQSFEKLEEPEVGLEIIHTGVGGVTEGDVMLAAASDAIIIAFNVTPDAGARQAAGEQRVDVRTYRVIYDVIADVKAAIKGLRAPVLKEIVAGHAEVRKLFRVPKAGVVAGCYVTDGKIARKNRMRVVRDGVIVYDGAIASLKHLKDDVRDIAAGFECGISLADFQDVKEGDILEAYSVEEVPR